MIQIPNWYVITGGPSSGKTTVVDELHHEVILGPQYVSQVTIFIVNQAIKNELNSTEVKENAYAVGVRAPITKQATLFASYTTGGKTSAANIDSKMTGYQAGGLYALSKRTDLYALYGASKMKADNVANESTGQGMALGIRHTF